MQRKLLTTLNSVLLIVTITYITRAVFVLDLFLEFSDTLTYSYVVWILCTHWMPHLLGKESEVKGARTRVVLNVKSNSYFVYFLLLLCPPCGQGRPVSSTS